MQGVEQFLVGVRVQDVLPLRVLGLPNSFQLNDLKLKLGLIGSRLRSLQACDATLPFLSKRENII